MTAHPSPADCATLAASVAPEDLRCGDFVCVLDEIFEYPSFLWCDSMPGVQQQLVRVRFCATGGGVPLRVKAICLPFVFVKSPCAASQTIDVRQVRLVRLKKQYARTVWKELRKASRMTKRRRQSTC